MFDDFSRCQDLSNMKVCSSRHRLPRGSLLAPIEEKSISEVDFTERRRDVEVSESYSKPATMSLSDVQVFGIEPTSLKDANIKLNQFVKERKKSSGKFSYQEVFRRHKHNSLEGYSNERVRSRRKVCNSIPNVIIDKHNIHKLFKKLSICAKCITKNQAVADSNTQSNFLRQFGSCKIGDLQNRKKFSSTGLNDAKQPVLNESNGYEKTSELHRNSFLQNESNLWNLFQPVRKSSSGDNIKVEKNEKGENLESVSVIDFLGKNYNLKVSFFCDTNIKNNDITSTVKQDLNMFTKPEIKLESLLNNAGSSKKGDIPWSKQQRRTPITSFPSTYLSQKSSLNNIRPTFEEKSKENATPKRFLVDELIRSGHLIHGSPSTKCSARLESVPTRVSTPNVRSFDRGLATIRSGNGKVRTPTNGQHQKERHNDDGCISISSKDVSVTEFIDVKKRKFSQLPSQISAYKNIPVYNFIKSRKTRGNYEFMKKERFGKAFPSSYITFKKDRTKIGGRPIWKW